MQEDGLKRAVDEKELKLDVPDSCRCGFGNFYFWGTKLNGRTHLEIRCMRCGANIWDVTLAPQE